MKKEVNEVLRRAEELGVDAKYLTSEILKRNKINCMDLFGYEPVYTYLDVQLLVDEIMSEDGCKIHMDCDWDGDIDVKDFLAADSTIEFLRANVKLVRYELERRGVAEVGYISDSISRVFVLKADIAGDDIMPIWDVLVEKKRQRVDKAMSESVQEALAAILKMGYGYTDAVGVIRKALAHKDIWDVRNLKNVGQFNKHDFDIYFASRELNGETIYSDADIEAEVSRMREYKGQNYEGILNMLNKTPNRFGCDEGCLHYWNYEMAYRDDKSLEDLLESVKNSIMAAWYRHEYGEIWGSMKV